jgi:hypothetical protein
VAGNSTLLPTLLKSRSLHDVAWAFKTAPILDWSVLSLVWPVFVYLGLYSFLPHKELRFIFNAIPILNMVSAVVRKHAAVPLQSEDSLTMLFFRCVQGLAKLYRSRSRVSSPTGTFTPTCCL